jgi:DNA-binding MarR family transcriptional regulator
LEEIIFQALSSNERRDILRVVRSRDGGAFYSDILGELGLTTGNLNYHLKQLEGFLQRDNERRYKLTPLGEKALATLNSAAGGNYGDYVEAARFSQSRSIHPAVTRLIIGGIIGLVFVLLVWGYIGYIVLSEGAPLPVVLIVAFLIVMGLFVLSWLIKALFTAPTYVRHLEKKLFLFEPLMTRMFSREARARIRNHFN